MAKPSTKHTYKDFAKSLGDFNKDPNVKKNHKIVVAFGPSDYLLNKAALAIKKNWSTENKSNSINTLEAKEVDKEKFYHLWELQSIFEPQYLYVIRRTEATPSLAKLFSTIPGSKSVKNHILLTYQGNQLPATFKKELTRLDCYMVPCFEPSLYELDRFIDSLSRRHKLHLQPNAIQLIKEAQGSDLSKLENEIIKLSLIFHGVDKPLSSSDIAPMIGMVREDHVFQLDNLLLNRKFAEAQALLSSLVRRGEKATALIGILAAHCRKAIKISAAHSNGLSERQIAANLRLPVAIVRNYTVAISKVKTIKYTKALDCCRIADIKLKTSGIDPEIIISEPLVQLAN